MPLHSRRPFHTVALALTTTVCAWPAQADAPAGTYTTTDTTVSDTHTGLEWQKMPGTTTATQTAAVSYCTDLGAGWRLPSVLELVSLVDEVRTGAAGTPAIDPVFTATAEYFWSATPYASAASPATGWIVNFGNGDTLAQPASTVARVRCVR